MLSQEYEFKQSYAAIIAVFQSAFPNIAPPEAAWFLHWFEKYPTWAVQDAIETLCKHPLKARFTTESTGRAISALLRNEALKRAVASVSTAAVSRA